MNNNTSGYKAVILAGGNSTRMNYPKAWLPYNKQTTFLEHLVDLYKSLECDQIIVVLNHQFVSNFELILKQIQESATIVINSEPEKGRLHSLKLGLEQISSTGYTFVHNVDMPQVSFQTLDALKRSNPDGYARPIWETKSGHPIVISPGVMTNVLLTDEDITLKELLSAHNYMDVLVDDSSIVQNINTPEEYKQFFTLSFPQSNVNRNESHV